MYFYTCNNRNKKTSEKYLSAATQYHLCFLLFLLLAVPFFPVQIHGSQLFSWLHFFQTDSGLNSGTDTLSELPVIHKYFVKPGE